MNFFKDIFLKLYVPKEYGHDFVKFLSWRYKLRSLRYIRKTNSQLFQEIIVIFLFEKLKKGFFVEVGACDGITFSNTKLLEKDFHWRGLLVEPAEFWIEHLKQNRSSKLDFRAVFSKSGEVMQFTEVREIGETFQPELSSLDLFSTNGDWASIYRTAFNSSYTVETVSLLDLFLEHDVPNLIDYLSLDIEGGELEALKEFDFSKFTIRFISVEHNFTENRPLIKKILLEKGYIQVLSGISKFDDFYLLNTQINSKAIQIVSHMQKSQQI